MQEATRAVGVGRRRIIPRPRLTRMLDESGARLILLVAPAGYGKTTLAQEWLGQGNRRAAWYRGGPASADVAALAVGLAQAAAEIVPGAGARMGERLKATERPEEDARVLAEMLAEDLADWPEDAWLAVDDYHFAMEAAAAEEFLDALAAGTPLQFLIASRGRPAWASARRRLYGEVLELDRTVLAMNDHEALEVLDLREDDAAQLLDQARGWPAIIGLAALTGELTMPEGELTATLYDYFAEELYQSASEDVQRSLCQLAVAPSISDGLTEFLLGPETAARTLDRAVRCGLLDITHDGYRVSPLICKFLRKKLAETPDSALRSAIDRISDFYIRERQWDDLFVLVTDSEAFDVLVRLVEEASDSLLASGRIATLETWLAYADEHHIVSPVLDFVEAEVAFRDGAYSKAETLAALAGQSLGRDHRFTSRSYVRAGQSALLNGAMESVAEHYEQARLTARSDNDLRNALWGRFLFAIERDLPESEDILDEFAVAAADDRNEQLRVATGRILLAFRTSASVELELLESIHLVPGSDDPLIQSSFFNAWTGLAAYLGRYADSLDACQRQLKHIARYRLNFVLPHMHLRRAVALRGLRRFGDALSSVADAARLAADIKDGYLVMAARITLALTELSRGRVDPALAVLTGEPATRLSPSWVGEYIACRAIALAVSGKHHKSLAAAQLAESMTHATEPRGLTSFARAIVAHQRGDEGTLDSIQAAYHQARSDHNVDGLVCSYRAYPPLLTALWSATDDPEFLEHAVHSGGDERLARSAGVPLSHAVGITEILSPREQEVHALLAQGLTNQEIAQALYISVSTVKVHVRHVLKKLGVRSRTEAATREITG